MAKLQVLLHQHELVALIDSGADPSFISQELARQLGLDREPLPHPVPVRALDGHLLATLTHQTRPVELLLADQHRERLRFHILDQPGLPLVLGFPWLQRHNPHIDWETEVVRG